MPSQAPSSPRRSSRASRTQPPALSTSNSNSNNNPGDKATAPASNNHSSASSVISLARDRPTRAASAKPVSTTPHSSASQLDDEQREQLLGDGDMPVPTRRSRRQLESEHSGGKPDSGRNTADNDDDVVADADEDGETTRCICGFQEYPGPPPIEPLSSNPHHRSKSSAGPPASGALDGDAQPDEPGSLFIQCDTCEVWQHGGCVGIMDEESTPENYFCERCKPDLHFLGQTRTGQKYSRYIPVVGKPPRSHQRKSSINKDWTPRPRGDSKKDDNLLDNPKRRSTMNSRATFDDEEMLRKVIEESKHDGSHDASDLGTLRKAKRLREGSDDLRIDIKRQRTDSSELLSNSSTGDAADPDGSRRRTNHREALLKKQREVEDREKERERAEAASKRQERAGRRRADELDDKKLPEDTPPSDDPPTAAATSLSDEKETSAAPTSAPADNNLKRPTTSSSSRNSKRGRNGRSGLVSRNSYNDVQQSDSAAASPKDGSGEGGGGVGSGPDTAAVGEEIPKGGPSSIKSREKDAKEKTPAAAKDSNGALTPHAHSVPPATQSAPPSAPATRRGRPNRGAAAAAAAAAAATNGAGDIGNGSGYAREPSMAELKRRANAMLEFISRSQKEMADAEERGLRPKSATQSGGATPSAPADAATAVDANVGGVENMSEEGAEGLRVESTDPTFAVSAHMAPDPLAAALNSTSTVSTADAAGKVDPGAASLADDLATKLVKWQQTYTGERPAAGSTTASLGDVEVGG